MGRGGEEATAPGPCTCPSQASEDEHPSSLRFQVPRGRLPVPPGQREVSALLALLQNWSVHAQHHRSRN